MIIKQVTDRNGTAFRVFCQEKAVRVLSERKARRVVREAASQGIVARFYQPRKVCGLIVYDTGKRLPEVTA